MLQKHVTCFRAHTSVGLSYSLGSFGTLVCYIVHAGTTTVQLNFSFGVALNQLQKSSIATYQPLESLTQWPQQCNLESSFTQQAQLHYS